MDTKDKKLKKFNKLPEEWRNELMSSDTAAVRKAISECAMNVVALRAAKDLDEDLASLKEQVKVANEVYSVGEKTNMTKIEFLVETLRGRGEVVPSIESFLNPGAGVET